MIRTRPLNLTRLGWGLTIPVLFLSTLSVASIRVADDRGADADDALIQATPRPAVAPADENWLAHLQTTIGPLALKQVFFMVTGLALMLVTILVPYQRLGEVALVIYFAVVALLLLLVADRFIDIPLIPVIRGSRRWIGGSSLALQPSEFMKPALIIALAWWLRYRRTVRTWTGLCMPFALTVIPMGLIILQPDLGTVLMLLPVLFAMLFVAGARLRHLGTIITLGIIAMPIFYFTGMKPYQRERVQVVLKQNTNDERWHMAQGYQLRQSKIAMATGGLLGEGYGRGVFVQYDLLPDEHNDFIFAIIVHQWGLLGGLAVVLAYVIIVFLGIEVAGVTNDPFGRLLVVGVIVMIVMQALLNIGMTMGLTPITGMTLPFVSYGGSSLWANFIALGLLVNVAKRRPMLIMRPPFEYSDD